MSSNAARIFIIGGHGKVALHFTRLASQAGHTVISQIRNASHSSDLPNPGPGKVEPLVESLEDLTVSQLAKLFKDQNPNVIVFAAGAGGKGGAERTFAVDRDGAIKVFDALEQANLPTSHFKRFLLVSAVDSRNIENTKPEWYTEKDFERSKKAREALGTYYQAKYEADLNLSKRTSFPWTVLRPSTLQDEPAGGVSLAEHSTITNPVPRESVAKVLLALAELPADAKGANGQMWDLTLGQGDVHDQVQAAVKRARTDWVG